MIEIIRFSRMVIFVLAIAITAIAPAMASQMKPVGYTIQAGAFQEQQRAEKFAETLRSKRLEAVYYKKDNGLFAVAFGNFTTWHAAAQRAVQLKQERTIDGYYITEPVRTGGGFANISSSNAAGNKTHDSELGKTAARTAERFVGLPYKWGGNTVVEGLDCSGFVKSVYYLVGLEIPRTSQEQFNAGTAIKKSEMKEGDLLFFGKGPDQISHVGMYIGNGKFVHAPRRGEPIQITPVDTEKYVQKYVGSRRFL